VSANIEITTKDAAALKKKIEEFHSIYKMFIEKYSVILPLYDGEGMLNSDVYSGVTFEQMEELKTEDVAYAILKNVQAISEHLNIPMEEVVEKGLESVGWYKDALQNALHWATKQAQPTQLVRALQMLDNNVPSKYIIPNNKLSNILTKEDVGLDMDLDIVLSGKKEVVTKVYLNYNDKNITICDEGKKFTPYDRTVVNAACSIYEAGNANFTAKQVYRCMNGLNDTQDVSPQAVAAITKSLDKARSTIIKIDCTQEAAAYKNNTDFKCEIEDYILPIRKVTLISGNEELIGYSLNGKPILYEYAQMSNQVLSVPSKLLNTKDVIRSTPEVIVIREYLIRRIEVMKNTKNNLGNKIAFSSIYTEIGRPEPTKEKASKVRSSVEKILGKYKKEKYIKDFEFYKEGRAFKGVQIKY